MDRTEPPTKLAWIDQFMQDIRRDYLFYDRVSKKFCPIGFNEETTTNDEGEENHYEEVCFLNYITIQPIHDEHVYLKHSEAEEAMNNLPPDNYKILAFRHPDNDWTYACTIEKTVLVNKLGWGIFRRRDLPEAPNTEEENK